MAEKTLSRQPRLENTKELQSWVWMLWNEAQDGVPAWGTPGRVAKLREHARAEPILSGALASMVSKVVSLDWQISGGRNRVKRFQEVLAEAEDGRGWDFFLERWVQDYLDTDVGGVVELGREGRNGPVAGLYNLDAECVQLTGSVEHPIRYVPKLSSGQLSGNSLPLRPMDYVHAVDMPSPDESKHGLGFCAVSRALKASKVLMALYHYEDERLQDMPLPGVAAVTGLTQPEILAAKKTYDAMRESKEQVTFKGLLWLAAQQSTVTPVDVKLTSFASLPEGFDKEKTITLYVYTLALDFGVDVREFWPASQTGATKAEAEVQAQKAKGKGFGRLLSSVERAINWDVMPEGLEFAFDQRDSEDDLLRETIREKVIANVRKLWEPAAGAFGPALPVTMPGADGAGPAAESFGGIISTAEARRWLVELQALPEWLAPGGELTAHGMADVDKAADSIVSQRVAEKAARAGLGPGEDFVAINSRGDVATLWSPRSVVVSNWPFDKLRTQPVPGVPAGGPLSPRRDNRPSW